MTAYVIDVTVNTKLAQANVKGLGDQFDQMAAAAKALAIGALAKETIELGDSFTVLSNKLKVVTDNQYQLNVVLDKTFDMAQQNRVAWDDLARGYSRIRQATEQLGLSQKETLTITDSITKLLKVGGATTQESASVMLHLTHAFDEGRLHGRQLNMVMMESIPIQRAIAKELGVTTGELRQLGKDGMITSAVLARAFIHANADATALYGKTVSTVSERFIQLKNSAEKMIGEFNKGSGVFGHIGDAIGFVARHLEELATVILTVTIPAIIALTVAWAASPLGLVTVVAGAAVVGALALADALDDTTAAEKAVGKAAYDAAVDTKGMLGAQLDAAAAIEEYRREHNALAETFHMVKLTAFDLTEAYIQNAAALRRVHEAIVSTGIAIQIAKIQAATGGEGFEGSVIRIQKTWQKINEDAKRGNAELEQRRAWWAAVKLAAQEADEAQQKALLMSPDRVTSGHDFASLAAQQSPLGAFAQEHEQRKQDAQSIVAMFKGAQEQIKAAGREAKIAREAIDTDYDGIISDQEGMNAGMRDLAKMAAESGKLVQDAWVNAFRAAEDSLTSFIRTGEFNFKKFTDSILDDLARILARQALLAGVSALGGNGLGGGAAGAAATFNSAGSGGFDTALSLGGTLLGSYLGGSGAAANQPVALRGPTAAPTAAAKGGTTVVQVINQLDPRSVLPVLDSPEGIRRINNGQRIAGQPPTDVKR